VLEEIRSIAGALGLNGISRLPEVLERAAALHDAGKASPLFQNALLSLCQDSPPVEGGLWAKAAGRGRRIRYGRDYFRHELAGAIALLSNETIDALTGLEAEERNLAIYLVASHHGRVRLSIRSVPGEIGPDDGRRFALGVWDGDKLPAAQLGGGLNVPAMRLDLSCMELGSLKEPSWAERAARLDDSEHLGPFRLGYLEALLRAADARASMRERR
jgi:CRISPR-associated endonuclease/helicase Cas3